MPAEEEGFHAAVVREEPTRKPRTNSTSIRAVRPKRHLGCARRPDDTVTEMDTRSRAEWHWVHNHQYPDILVVTPTSRSDMSPALPPRSHFTAKTAPAAKR